jgi:excinuclease ABC subunit C
VCIGAISRRAYGAIIKNVILFLEGKRGIIMRRLEREMKRAAASQDFEHAAKLRNQLRALEHIQDIAIIKRDFYEEPHAEESINIFGRIEGYDISNIGGAQAVGSMVVFEGGEPKKSDYRKFRIKSVRGSNDVAMLTEVVRRRLRNRDWPLPDIMLIDGGKGQVNAARRALAEARAKIPIIGIAKGPDRKKDEFIYERGNWELARITELYSYILKHVRDESHRFAIRYHRRIRGREFLA